MDSRTMSQIFENEIRNRHLRRIAEAPHVGIFNMHGRFLKFINEMREDVYLCSYIEQEERERVVKELTVGMARVFAKQWAEISGKNIK